VGDQRYGSSPPPNIPHGGLQPRQVIQAQQSRRRQLGHLVSRLAPVTRGMITAGRGKSRCSGRGVGRSSTICSRGAGREAGREAGGAAGLARPVPWDRTVRLSPRSYDAAKMRCRSKYSRCVGCAFRATRVDGRAHMHGRGARVNGGDFQRMELAGP
jgi:hypothetical protein